MFLIHFLVSFLLAILRRARVVDWNFWRKDKQAWNSGLSSLSPSTSGASLINRGRVLTAEHTESVSLKYHRLWLDLEACRWKTSLSRILPWKGNPGSKRRHCFFPPLVKRANVTGKVSPTRSYQPAWQNGKGVFFNQKMGFEYVLFQTYKLWIKFLICP